MEIEKNKSKSRLQLMKLIIVGVSSCLLFRTSVILFFAGLLNGGIQYGLSLVIVNAINYLGENPTGALFSFGFKIIIIFVIYKILINIVIKRYEKKENAERTKKSISENGIIRHYAKEIIQNYGNGSFVNKTSDEIEDVVYEYNDLFKMKFSRDDVVCISREINESVNGCKGN
jgi:hypothetical protein